MEIYQWIGLFVISLAVLLKSAQYFTETSEKIGLHFHIPPFIIGVTIIAFGTSLPEIATSLISVFQGHSEIVIGNVVGSNIANILLVMGGAAVIGKNLLVNKDIIKIDLPILLGSTILLYLTTIDGKFTYIDGTLCLLVLVAYIVYNTTNHRVVEGTDMQRLKKMEKEEKKEIIKLPIKYPAILIASATFLYFSADFTIKSVVNIAEFFEIGTAIIAVSAIAVGTSLPELIVSGVAARQGKADIAIGNIIGSNIFNVLAVMGIPSLFGNLTIPKEFITFTIPTLLLVTILYIFTTMDKEISQWEGITFLLLFVAFMGKTFGII